MHLRALRTLPHQRSRLLVRLLQFSPLDSVDDQIPGRDKQGAVFTISHGSVKAVWLIAQHDLEAKHFQYVYFIADVMVTTIDVQFRVVDLGTTQVTVTYARTSVSPEGDTHVQAMSEADRAACKEWQAAIDEYLASRKPAVVR